MRCLRSCGGGWWSGRQHPRAPVRQPLSPSTLTTARRLWSLAATLTSASASATTPPTGAAAAAFTVERLLEEVRSQAAASPHWTVDFGELTSSPAHSLRTDAQLVGRVSAALAGVLTARAAPLVTSLRLTITSPEAAHAVRRLCDTTPLLAALQSLDLTVDASAAGAPQDGMEGAGGHEVALLLQALAAHQRARQTGSATWTALRVAARDTTVLGAPASTARAPLWDDAAVAALTALVAAAAWRSLALFHIDLYPSSVRVRQRLWAAIEGSAGSLVSLELSGVRHTRELVYTRALRRLVHLDSLELSNTQLEEDALVLVLDDLREGRGGWWALRHLGLAQCEVSDSVVTRLHEHRPDPSGETAPALESLNVSGAGLSRSAVFALAGCLLPCTRLRRLHTRHCRLLPASVEDVASSLQHATELLEWVLCLNRIGDEGLASLAAYARCWPALSEMDLSRCRLTCASLPALSGALPCWGNLRTLRLTGNDLRWRDSGASHLPRGPGMGGLFAYDAAYMRSHGRAVKVPTAFELDRRDREEGRERYTGTEGVVNVSTVPPLPPLEQLGEALSTCTQLRVLDLGDCAMGDAQLVQLATHFTGAALRELRLGSNPLLTTVLGLDALVTILWRTPRLGILDLSFTGLGDLGVSMLCDGTPGDGGGAVLPSAAELHTLLLAGCGVASLGWDSLAAAAGGGYLPALRHLAMHHNPVADVALVSELLRQLRTASALATVDLSECVTGAEAQRWLQGSAECRALRERGVQVLL